MHERTTVDWSAVIRKGTGFFARSGNPPTAVVPGEPPHDVGAHGSAGSISTRMLSDEEARGATFQDTAAVLSEAESYGADGEFLRACVLNLSERSLDYVRTVADAPAGPDTALHWTPSRTRILALQDIPGQVNALRQLWVTQAYEALEFADAVVIDQAFIALETDIRHRLQAFGVPPRRLEKDPRKRAGRPDLHRFLLVFSGLAEHMKKMTGHERYAFLAKLAAKIVPPLPRPWTKNSLRSAVFNYRRAVKAQDGHGDLSNLLVEFDRLRSQLLSIHV